MFDESQLQELSRDERSKVFNSLARIMSRELKEESDRRSKEFLREYRKGPRCEKCTYDKAVWFVPYANGSYFLMCDRCLRGELGRKGLMRPLRLTEAQEWLSDPTTQPWREDEPPLTSEFEVISHVLEDMRMDQATEEDVSEVVEG